MSPPTTALKIADPMARAPSNTAIRGCPPTHDDR
jgi:hypothetical protein